MEKYKSGEIFAPHETNGGSWVVVWQGWHVRATDEQNAKRQIDNLERAESLGASNARAQIRAALGIETWGNSIIGIK